MIMQKEDIGKKSQNAVISALEQFKLFVSGETGTINRRKKSSEEIKDVQNRFAKPVSNIEKKQTKIDVLQPKTEKQRGFELKIFGITVIKWSIKES